LENFSRPDLDLCIRSGRGQWPGLRSHRLMVEDLVPLCTPELARSGSGLQCPGDLAHYTLIHDLPRLGQAKLAGGGRGEGHRRRSWTEGDWCRVSHSNIWGVQVTPFYGQMLECETRHLSPFETRPFVFMKRSRL